MDTKPKKQTKPKKKTKKPKKKTKPKKDISLNDISYKYMPISVFHVKPIGMKGIRGKQHHDRVVW